MHAQQSTTCLREHLLEQPQVWEAIEGRGEGEEGARAAQVVACELQLGHGVDWERGGGQGVGSG